MEDNGHAFLGSDHRETAIPVGGNELRGNGWCFDGFGDYPSIISSNQSFEGLSMPSDQSLNWSSSELHCPFADNSSINKLYWPSFPIMEDEHLCSVEPQASCKLEPEQTTGTPNSNLGLCPERENKVKKKDGLPSKNLMAERRRRKRLNDRLLMLRSVVPKISKTDRKSILRDTIDYMNELLERIKNLQEEIEVGSIRLNTEPNHVLVRNSPKFDVEKRDMNTHIEISCPGEPGLLLSTVTTLENLGLEIEQCVVSCFDDFAMQASCLEKLEQGGSITSADIKEALSKNAGYEGVFRDEAL